MPHKFDLFAMQSKPRFLNYSINFSDFDQTLIDWLRDGTQEGLINIHGVDLKHLLSTRFPESEIDSSKLFELLHDEIIEKLHLDYASFEARELMLFLMRTLHQGACLHLMQTALCEEAARNGYMIRGSDTRAHVNIEVRNNAIYIQEDVRVAKLIQQAQPEMELFALGGELDSGHHMPIIFGSATQKIALNGQGQVSHELVDSSITYGSEEAKKIIDQRSLLQRIMDFFMALLNISLKISHQPS